MNFEEAFNVRTNEEGLRLITPALAVANALWTPQTVHYRSRVEDKDGNTISQGFPKFFNLGMGPSGLNVSFFDVVKAAEKGDALATLKLDGSLLIRSVYNEKVMLRTRGSFGYEQCDNAFEMEVFKEKYPKVFDPRSLRDVSLLFEWTSPNNTIVVKYPEPSLTLVGAVYHEGLTLMPLDELCYFANILQVPVVEHFTLTPDGWETLHNKLDERQDIEGYVIRLNGEQTLVKVKAAPYLTKHAMKSRLTTESLADLYFQWGCPDFEGFCKRFRDVFDEECCMWALGAISSLYDGVREFTAIFTHMEKKAIERRHLSRKEAALSGIADYGQTKRFSCYMQLWEGKEVATELKKSVLLQCSKQVELSMFSKQEAYNG
jgi:hypothetical protein